MINIFSIGEESEISDLILRVFDQFVGFEYSETGRNHFRNYVRPESIIERYKIGNIMITYKNDNKITGFIEVRDNEHISLFFVDPDYHKRGIGKLLMQEVLKILKGKTDIISVNSSKYAVPVYNSLGFKETGVLQEKDGIQFVPMIMHTL